MAYITSKAAKIKEGVNT